MSRNNIIYLIQIVTIFLVAACGNATTEPVDSAVSDSRHSGSMADLLDDRRSFLAGLGSEPGNQACTDTWRSTVADGRLDITLANGYFDNEWQGQLIVGDGLYRDTVVSHLTDACIPGYNACGFTIDQDDPTKNVVVLSKSTRDREGNALTVSITITSSSVTMFDEDNRGSRLTDQRAMSRLATSVFHEGIAQSDLVFYFGHARDGGGPDFSFPRLRRGTIHVDYPWYHANKPGITDLLSELGATGNQIKMLGLFACASKPHFHRSILRTAPSLGLIESDDVIGSEPLRQAVVGAIDAAIGQKCQRSFNKSIDLDPANKVALVNFF